MITIKALDNLQVYNREDYMKALLVYPITGPPGQFFMYKDQACQVHASIYVQVISYQKPMNALRFISKIFTIIVSKCSVNIMSCRIVTKLLGRRKRAHNRKCEIAWYQLTNHNDVVDSVGDGPTETTAETTTKKKAWEPLKSF